MNINDDEEKAASRDDVERIPPRPNKPKNDEAEEEDKDFKLPDYDYSAALSNSKTPVNYDIGKSSSTVSQYPTAAGYVKAAKEKLSPYQKYSFQPVTEAAASDFIPKLDQAILSTLAPFNPTYSKLHEPIETQSSESSLASLKGCRKLIRPSSDGLEQMNCFVCENADSKSKYTQCSYAAEKDPVGYYTANSQSYSLPSKEPHQSYRYKRYTHDPYFTIRERSRKAFDEPTIPKEYNLGFYYDPESYDGSSSELSYSEKQTEELKKNPANCKKVESEGMTCTVCKDPATGGNYEQCSYSSEPKENKYAYVTEKKYNSEDEPEETRISVSKSSPAKNESAEQQPEASKQQEQTQQIEQQQSQEQQQRQTQEQQQEQQQATSSDVQSVIRDIEPIEPQESRIVQTRSPRKRRENESEDEEEESKEELNEEEEEEKSSSAEDRKPNQKQKLDDYYYEIPSHFAETVRSSARLGHHNHEDVKDDDKEEEKEDNTDESSEFDHYHFKLFPELKKNKQASAEEDDEEEEYQIPAATKHNVEEVLAEFTRKDRSACKKSEKNGMTCFLCVDKNNIQNEECMYVQESRPVSSHIAYHEVKGLKKPEQQGQAQDETNAQPVVVSAIENASPLIPLRPLGAPSTILPYEIKINSAKRKRSVPEAEQKEAENQKKKTVQDSKKSETRNENEEPTLKTPTEFQVADEEGAFSAETKPVYSKTHGVELPRYMVEQSEFEKEFDVSASTF